MELTGTIDDNGQAHIYRRKELEQWFLDNKGKQFTMTVARKKKKRSNDQNEYYWAVVVPMVQAAMNEYGSDYSKQETHEYLKKEFNWVEIEVREGNYIKAPQSTTKLSTVDFIIYLDKIYLFASEVLGIEIPQPNQQMTILTITDPSLPDTTIYDKIN